MIRRPPSSPLFPYTTLSRSVPADVLELVVAASLHGVLRAEDRVDRRSQGLRAVDHKEVFPVRFHAAPRSEEHTSELQSQSNLVCRLLLEKKKNKERLTKVMA